MSSESTKRIAAAIDRIDSTLAAKRAERAANQAQAPICAAFVQEMRDAFGAGVAVTYVNEDGFVMGKPDERPTKDSGPIFVAEKKGKREVEKHVANWVHL